MVQGITGGFGGRHAQLSLDYGTQLVAGVTPGKGGQVFEHGDHKVPVFNTVEQAVKETGATASAIFVPPAFAGDAILESVDAGIALVVAITEGIPVRDMMKVKAAMAGKEDVRLVEPNCPRSLLRVGREFTEAVGLELLRAIYTGGPGGVSQDQDAHLRGGMADLPAWLRADYLRRYGEDPINELSPRYSSAVQ